MAYTSIIFDFFGVICSEVAPFWLAQHVSASDAISIKKNIIGSADRGSLSQQELFTTLGEIAGLPSGRVEEEWMSYVKIDRQVVALIQALRPKYKLGMLTNSPAPFVREIVRRHQLADLFSSVVVSSENGCAKPDRKIYEIMLHALSANAGEALMIDDNALNIEGAAAVGMGGILFESCEQVKEALAAYEIYPGSAQPT